MKYLIFLLFVGISFLGNAKWGYSLRDYSLLYGRTFFESGSAFNAIEFQFDKVRRNCFGRSKYRGFGVSYGFGKETQRYGLKGMFNPTKQIFYVTRRIRFEPYLMLQANLVRENKSFANYQNNISPGLGFNGICRISRSINLRPQFQVRYNVNEEYLENKNGLRFDIRLGIGISSFRSKKNRYKK